MTKQTARAEQEGNWASEAPSAFIARRGRKLRFARWYTVSTTTTTTTYLYCSNYRIREAVESKSGTRSRSARRVQITQSTKISISLKPKFQQFRVQARIVRQSITSMIFQHRCVLLLLRRVTEYSWSIPFTGRRQQYVHQIPLVHTFRHRC